MAEQFEAVVIGAGHAGLSASYYLSRAGMDHVVLEQTGIGETWRTKRWDSFTLVTPNWTCKLPGYPYSGNDPDGFMPREDIVRYLEGYAASFQAPVRTGVRVTAVDAHPSGSGYLISASEDAWEAPIVVIATGFFEQPKIPAAAASIPRDILQIHSSRYKNPDALPPGGVLVIGSAQSGCQIAEELQESGRQVYLSTGSAGRAPRRYRGKDAIWWTIRLGTYDRTVDQLPSPQAKFAGNPHLSGKRGGHTLNLHRFAHDGMILLGRFHDIRDGRMVFAADLQENLAKADKFAVDFRQGADEYCRKTGLDLPPADPGNTDEYDGDDGYRQKEILDLDLQSAGIGTIVWAAGFNFDYSFVRRPVFDEIGYPVQRRGVTASPGLYFMGVHFQHAAKSDLFYGVGEDAAYIAAAIAQRPRGRPPAGAAQRQKVL